MNKFDEVTHIQMRREAHMQMRREQLKKLEAAAAAAAAHDNTPSSLVDDVWFAGWEIMLRSYVWFVAKACGVAMVVANVFSRQASNDFRLIEFKMIALAVFSSVICKETERSELVGDAYDALAECVNQAYKEQECVLARIYDAGGVDAIENDGLRAEFDRVNTQAETVIQKVNAMYREVVTFRNIWRP